MCISAIVGGSLLGGAMQMSSANKAASAQTASNRESLALQREIYDDTSAKFDPFRKQGLNAFNALNFEMGLGNRPAGYSGFQETPGYQFALQQGTDAIEGSAAAGGNLRSGATMKALQNHGIGMANQEYGNFMNRMTGIAGMGQAAAGNQAAAGANFSQGASNSLSNIGNAQSAGAIAQGNAMSGMVNNITGGYMMNQIMNAGA